MIDTIKITNRRLNKSITFGDEEITDWMLQKPLVGFGKPKIRMSSGEYAERDGGYVSAQYYSFRDLSIPVALVSDSCQSYEDHRKDFQDVLEIRQALDIVIKTMTGKYLVTQGYLVDPNDDITGIRASKFKIELRCPDNNFYEAGANGEADYINSAIFTKVAGGGYLLPHDIPWNWAQSSQPTTVINSGNTYTAPNITLTGRFTNPKITNITTGKVIQVSVTTTQPTDVIIIDMAKKQITLNGGSIYANKTPGTDFWNLAPGANQILFETDSGSDNNSGLIQWRSAIQGV